MISKQRRMLSVLLAGLALALFATSCAPEDDLGTVANPQQSATPTAQPTELTGGIVDD